MTDTRFLRYEPLRYEPRNGIGAWFVLPIYNGWWRGRPVRVVAPVGHTEEIRRNRRRKRYGSWWLSPAEDEQMRAVLLRRQQIGRGAWPR